MLRLNDYVCRSHIWIRESSRSQTFAEYALIFASLSIAAFAAYETLGQSAVVWATA
jgi:hypothetical protein